MKTDLTKISPEDFELLVEDIIKKLGFVIEQRATRGPDRGKDILATRIVTDDMGINHSEKYLIECKHFATSGKSVQEQDIGNFIAKLSIHKANRYLIACTTILSPTVSDQINAISEDNAYNIKCASWCKNDIEYSLLRFPDLKEMYFGSHRKVSLQDRINIISNYFNKHHFEAQRGAVLFCAHYTAFFGNDGYRKDESSHEINPLVKNEIELVREKIKEKNYREIGFGLSDDKYTWTLLVDTKEVKSLNELIWECYPKGGSNNEIQYQEAFKRLWSYWHEPFFTDCDHHL